MKKINLFTLILFLFLLSCGNAGKILRNEKINTTDEFLVKKKNPLKLPPDIDKIPRPGTISEVESSEEDSFKKIISKDSKKSKVKEKKSNSLEESILKRLP